MSLNFKNKVIKWVMDFIKKNKEYISLSINGFMKYRGDNIRVSISYLYRIKIDGKYLLVKSKRIPDQYQPVGGVYKVNPTAKAKFNELGVIDESGYSFDDSLRNDLRVKVPQKNLVKLVKWFESGKDREVNQQREFIEELVNTGILCKDKFSYINPIYIKRNEYKLNYSHHFSCPELLIREIYELNLTNEQENSFRALLNSEQSDYYRWFEAEEIEKLGNTKQKQYRIGQHTLDIL